MANLKIPIEIELSEEAKEILLRFISAVETLENRDANKNITLEISKSAFQNCFEKHE